MSIKPVHAQKILSGNKKYEFRKGIFAKADIEKIYVYESSPVKRITGFFTLDKIICAPPSQLWEQTKHSSGVSKDDFFKYFGDRPKAIAIKVGSYYKFRDNFNPYLHIDNFKAPQSFMYTDLEIE